MPLQAGMPDKASKNAQANHQRKASAAETDTQNLNKRSYNNNTQNQSIHLRGSYGRIRAIDHASKHVSS